MFHPYEYINKPLAGGSWFSANEKWKLTSTEILKAIANVHQTFFIGTRAGKTSQFAVLDIDDKSKYHNKRELDKILQVLSQAGLTRSSLFRSSESGGWHLYIFFDEPIGSMELRRQLVRLLTVHDFHIAKGTLEVFPNRGRASAGMGLRLPLQPGFAWLDKKTLEVEYERYELTPTKALEFFIDALEADAHSFADFRKLKAYNDDMETRKATSQAHALAHDSNVVPIKRSLSSTAGDFIDFVSGVFHRLPPGIIVDNWYKGRLYHLNGLTGPSQRAEAIICLGHYFFYGDPSRNLPALGYGCQQERHWAIEKFLSLRHNGQSKDINKGDADALAQAERATNWRPAHRDGAETQKYSKVRPISWIRENENREADARERIQAALDELKKHQRAFTTVELQQSASCSRATLYRHQDIWRAAYEDRKNYRDLAVGFFANCTDEYNGAERAGSPQTEPSSGPSQKIENPGLLAARRVADEISFRRQRDIAQKNKSETQQLASSEKQFQSELDLLTTVDRNLLTTEELKARIVVLLHLVSRSPCEEQQKCAQKLLAQYRNSLAERFVQLRLYPPNSG
ncbi:MAG: hypothetical protein K2Z81_02805 [Cyanobacteria bacterium]|nr:hypothetical protein [Cyanobacteriota bacterium]